MLVQPTSAGLDHVGTMQASLLLAADGNQEHVGIEAGGDLLMHSTEGLLEIECGGQFATNLAELEQVGGAFLNLPFKRQLLRLQAP